MPDHPFRTRTCGELRKADAGRTERVSGWVHRKRDHGGVVFIDLRDHYGITQVVGRPESSASFAVLQAAKHESVIVVDGKVAERSPETVNTAMATGEVEVIASAARIESEAELPPFQIAVDEKVNEELRLQYRFLDLRREKLHQNVLFRSKVAQYIRAHLSQQNFTEIQTPILTCSSPEGARDFLVPSRMHPGKFYALPQAPQQFKQLLMVAGFDRYFQIAPCFRDEDARADRSPGEFYQLDMEMSFITQDDLFLVLEKLFDDMTRDLTDKKIAAVPFPRITFNEAMNRFGTDKPDLRISYELVEVADIFKGRGFRAFEGLDAKGKTLKALAIPGTASESRSFFDKAEEQAKTLGAAGLGYIVFKEDGPKGPIAKFLDAATIAELQRRTNAKTGDAVFFGGGDWLKTVKLMGEMRRYFAEKRLSLSKDVLQFCWIVDFPMYEWNEEEKKTDFCHNPFSMPQGGLEALEKQDPLSILAYQYDIVCNGIELSSGAIRNHRPEIMYKAFEIAGYPKEEVDRRFGHMIRAFRFGAPPHGGIAPGLDRIVMIYRDEPSIREVIPFPMNGRAQDVMMGAPSEVADRQLRELCIQVVLPEKPA